MVANESVFSNKEKGKAEQRLNRKYLFPVIFILISVLQFIFLFVLNNQELFAPDATGYHNAAVNIINYGIYNSSDNKEGAIDYEPKFMREPGYILFLSGVYKLYSIFGDLTHIGEGVYDVQTCKLLVEVKETMIVKYLQYWMMIFSIWLFYLTLKLANTKSMSIYLAIVSILYFPFVQASTHLLREALVAFFLALYTYLLAQYIIKGKHVFLWGAVIVIALASLTWQVMIVFTILVFVAMLLRKESFFKSIIHSFLYAVLFIAIMLPWILTVYAYYPDIRILKSGGTSLTHEVMELVSALQEAQYCGRMTNKEVRDFEEVAFYSLSSKEVFDRSFKGWYKNAADSIRVEIGSSKPMHYRFRANRLFVRFSKMLIQKNWWPLIKYSFRDNRNINIVVYLLYGISFLLAILFPLGFIKLSRQQLILLLPYIMYCALFWIIGSEYRRFVPIIPVMLFSAMNLVFHEKSKFLI